MDEQASGAGRLQCLRGLRSRGSSGNSHSCCPPGEGNHSQLLLAAVLLAAVGARSCQGGRSQGRLLAGSAAVGRPPVEVVLLLEVAAGKVVVLRVLRLGMAVGRSRQVLHSR